MQYENFFKLGAAVNPGEVDLKNQQQSLRDDHMLGEHDGHTYQCPICYEDNAAAGKAYEARQQAERDKNRQRTPRTPAYRGDPSIAPI